MGVLVGLLQVLLFLHVELLAEQEALFITDFLDRQRGAVISVARRSL